MSSALERETTPRLELEEATRQRELAMAQKERDMAQKEKDMFTWTERQMAMTFNSMCQQRGIPLVGIKSGENSGDGSGSIPSPRYGPPPHGYWPPPPGYGPYTGYEPPAEYVTSYWPVVDQQSP